MKRILSKLGVVLLLAALGAGAWCLQRPKEIAPTEQAVPPPSPAAELIVAGLGGFRGIAAEVIWFRCSGVIAVVPCPMDICMMPSVERVSGILMELRT